MPIKVSNKAYPPIRIILDDGRVMNAKTSLNDETANGNNGAHTLLLPSYKDHGYSISRTYIHIHKEMQ